MAEIDDLYSALAEADRRGATSDAQALAQAIGEAQAHAGSGTAVQAQVPQATGLSRYLKLGANALGLTAGNVLGIPGGLEDSLESGISMLTGLPGPRATMRARTGYSGGAPNAEDLAQLTGRLGLTNRQDTLEKSPAERYATAAATGIGSSRPMLLAPEAGLASTLTTGLAGGLAGEAAHEFAPESKAAPVIAGLVAGLGTGSVAGMLERNVATKAAQARVAQARTNLDLARDNAFYGKADHDTLANSLIQSSKEALDATKSWAQQHVSGALEHVGATAEGIAHGLGGSTTVQEAGEAMQAHARDWLTHTMPGKIRDAWTPLDQTIPPTASSQLPAFQQALRDINTSAGALEPVNALLKPGLPKAIGKTLDNIQGMDDLSLDGPISNSPDFTWGNIKVLRSSLGDAMSDPKTVAAIGAKNLSKLYATLSSDMRGIAAEHGATDLFDNANQESSRLYGLAEGPVAKIVAGPRASAADPAPEKVAGSFLAGGKRGASDLAALRTEMPEAVNELGASFLRTSPGKWTSLSPEAKATLVPNSDHAQALDEVLTAADLARTHAGDSISTAAAQHAATAADARTGAKAGKFTLDESVRNAQKEAAAAKQSMEPKTSLGEHVVNGLSSLAGATVGPDISAIALRAMDFPGSDIVHQAIGGVLGFMAPKLVRGAVNLGTNPGATILPATGALSGGSTNQLSLAPSR
jgi:hypothetical protein